MLDNADKKWIIETIDEKLGGAKTELRGEMQEMKTELRGEMQDMKTEIIDKMEEMKIEIAEEVTRHAMVVFENTYQQYLQIIGENIPDQVRSYNMIREQQERHQASIELLDAIVKDLDYRVTALEHTAG